MQLIKKTKLVDFSPLNLNGQMLFHLHKQIVAVLAKNGIGDQQFELAEARVVKSLGEIHWYSRKSGNPIEFQVLQEEEIQTKTVRFSQIVSQIASSAEELLAQEGRQEQTEGKMLQGVISGAGPENLMVIDDCLILCDWGGEATAEKDKSHVISSAAAGIVMQQDDTELAVDATPAAVRAEEAVIVNAVEENPEEKKRGFMFGWLWPLIPFLLLLLLLLLFFRGCSPIGVIPVYVGPPTPIPEVGPNEEAALRQEIDKLRKQLEEKVHQCELPQSTDAQRLEREGSSTGVINVSLIWNNRHDLDLVVKDPNGELIYFRNKQARSGGYLDIDQNASGRSVSEPIENIKWDQGTEILPGKYEIYVVFYKVFGADKQIDPTPYQVITTIFGERKEYTGEVSQNRLKKQIYVGEFTIP